MFADLRDDDIEWFAAAGATKSYPKGSILIQQGKPITEVSILLDGQLSVLVGLPQGGRTISTLREGELIGELSFLDSRPPSASVVATTSATVLAISRDKLLSRLNKDMTFAAKFYRSLGVLLADRLRNSTEHLGFGTVGSLYEDDTAPGEMDPRLLDSLAIAGKRFESLIDRLKSGRAS